MQYMLLHIIAYYTVNINIFVVLYIFYFNNINLLIFPNVMSQFTSSKFETYANF
jgi:hypothetical protein